MTDHIPEWLGAYHDGELHGARLRQIEQHLAGCAACQAELDAIRNLSALLQEPAPSDDFLPGERFAANLALLLPRPSEQPEPRNAFKIGWWLIPVGLLGLWLFIDITFSLSSVVTFAADSGLLGGHLTWLQGSPLQMTWFATAMDLFGSQVGAPGRAALSVLNEANLFIAQIAGKLIPQAILAAAYLGWLFVWWLGHQRQRSQSAGSFSQPG